MLYLHTQDLRRLMPLLEATRPAYVLALDPDVESARRCHEMGIKLIVRMYGNWDSGNPLFYDARGLVSVYHEQPWWPYAWAVTSPNEPHTPENVLRPWLAEFVAAIHEFGKECVVGNWANGWDGFLVPGARWYGAHAYGWPTLQEPDQAPYMALRHRQWFPAILAKNPEARLFLTELGLTQAVL